MGAGHGGPSGRYDAWRDEATVLAFVCDVGRRRRSDRRASRRRRARRATGSRSRPSCAEAAGTATPRARGRAVPSAPAVRRHHAQHRDLGAVRRAPGRGLPVPALQLPRRGGQRRRLRRGRAASRSTSSPRSTRCGRAATRRCRSSLVGWSFGADIALTVADARVAGWVAIAPPLRFRPTFARPRPTRARSICPRRARRVPAAGRRSRREVAAWPTTTDRDRRRARATSSWAAPTASSRETLPGIDRVVANR